MVGNSVGMRRVRNVFLLPKVDGGLVNRGRGAWLCRQWKEWSDRVLILRILHG